MIFRTVCGITILMGLCYCYAFANLNGEIVTVHLPFYESQALPLWAVFLCSALFGAAVAIFMGLIVVMRGRQERRERRLRLLVLEEELLALRNLPLKETVEQLEGPGGGVVGRAGSAGLIEEVNSSEGRADG